MSQKGAQSALEEEKERVRQPTEKGAQWQLEVKQKNWKGSVTAWRRKANKLRTTLTEEELDMAALKVQRDSLQDAMDKAIEVQDELSAISTTLSLKDDGAEKLDEIEEEHAHLMKEVHQVLKILRGDISSSKISTAKSSLSSTKKKENCQEWVNSMKSDVAASHHSNDEPLQVNVAESQEPQPILPSQPASQDSGDQEKTKNHDATKDSFLLLADSLRDQLHLNRLPLPEPSIFTGNALQYTSWKSSYKLLIEHSKIPAHERFFYLLKFVKGEPRDLIEGFSMIASEESYFEAWSALDDRYGDEFIISNAFRDKLDRWPKITSKDSHGLRRFSDYLRQCCTAMKKVKHLHHLDDERENRKLLTKLPEWVINKWARCVSSWRSEQGRFPPFSVFAKFIEEESTIACDPVISLASLKEVKGKSSTSASTMYTSTSSGTGHGKPQQRKEHCIFCKGQHRLDGCNSFVQQDLSTKRVFISKNGLCFGCLRKGHVSKDCKRRCTCTICKKRHPTPLHGDVRRKSSETDQSNQDVSTQHNDTQEHRSTSSCAMIDQLSSASSMIVPVWLSHANCKEERMIYALLDTQSDTSFILESTKDAMGLRGVEVNLRLSTMSSRDERIQSERIEGLSVRSHDGKKKIRLPPTYVRDIMPANRSHIPTCEMVESIPHLHRLCHHLLPMQDCEIGLLIGYDCATALMPRDVIPAPYDAGPYGIKTDLGWSIVGTVRRDYERRSEDPIGISHRVMACEVPVNLRTERKGVLFSQKVTVKEEITPSRVIKLMEADFLPDDHEKPYSQNDKKFLKVMEEGIHITETGHNEMPLPFKMEDPDLPNNQYQAENRLRGVTQSQKMSDLPKDRVEPAPPFTYSGMDCFGPWVIREGRKEMKRYGLLFTCMASRAVHIETLNSLTTDAFINALRRFLSVRGPVRQLRSDRGTNFIGAEAEFKRWTELNHDKVNDFLMREGCDCINFNFNVPSASHMGGTWERQIRSIRRALDGLMHQAGHQLDDESLRTFMCEAAAIVNGRPLAVDNLYDPAHPEPITPNHLLTMKTRVLLPPPGQFVREDLYSRKRWRRVQHLVNEFWCRWKKEFLQNLQSRHKWVHPKREAQVGDVVIVKDDNTPRNQWLMGRITDTFPSEDGFVRKVKLVIADAKLSETGKRTQAMQTLERPVHKLVTLLTREDQDEFPAKEP